MEKRIQNANKEKGNETNLNINDNLVLLNKLILSNTASSYSSYKKYINPKIIGLTIFFVIAGTNQERVKKMISSLICYIRTQAFNKIQRQKMISQIRYYLSRYQSLHLWKKYHWELFHQLKNSLFLLQYEYYVSVVIGLILGFVIGTIFISIRNKFFFEILENATTQLEVLTKLRTNRNLPHNFLNRLELRAKTKIFNSKTFLNYKQVMYSETSLNNLLINFQEEENKLTKSREFLIGNYYFDFATGTSFLGSKRAAILNTMESMADRLQIDWNGTSFNPIQSE